jgi:unsaturated chondroitin disaccharide hydrolase
VRRLALATAALICAASALVPGATTSARMPDGSRADAAPRITIDDFSTGAKQWRAGRASASRRTVAGEPVLTLKGGTLSRSLPRGDSVSFDLRLSRGARTDVALGRSGVIHLRELHGRIVAGGTALHRTLAPRGWYRVEAAAGRVTLDGQRVKSAGAGNRLSIHVTSGAVDLRALIAGADANPQALLLQRLAWLHTRTPRGKQPIGTGLDDRLRFSRSWTRGFWPGSLWHAYDLTQSAMFKRWARQATRDNFGAETADTHDLGFMYELSSAVAYDHLCTTDASTADCKAFRSSALKAASSLLKLAKTNEAVGTIPTRSAGSCTGCTGADESDTIVDSVMNLPLLFWASRVTGDPRYRDVAARHAHVEAADMVRSDGSTWSSMHNRRSDGAFIEFHTHQGYTDDSTWARGQAWAVHGFAEAAIALKDAGLLDTAQRTARYVMTRLPTPAVPLYDYDAPPSKPHDVSAGVITAAGMLRLATACQDLAATCNPSPADARSYAQRLLTASLAQLGKRPPLGFLGHQVYGLGGNSKWDDDAEMTFGINYALESLQNGG